MIKRRVLIVGATGFLGPHVVRAFVENGDQAVCLLRPGRLVTPLLQNSMTFIQSVAGDDCFLEADPFKPFAKNMRFDFIVNLAAYGVSPRDRNTDLAQAVNAELPLALLNAAEIMSASLIHAGSSAEYAAVPCGHFIRESDPVEQGRLYGMTKAIGTEAVIRSAGERSIGCAVLRLFNVYGSGEAPHRLVPAIVSKLLSGERAALSPGTQMRDFIHAQDAARAFVAASNYFQHTPKLSKPIAVNICTGKPISVAAFARIVAACLDADPALLGFGDIPMRTDDLPWVVGTPIVAKKLLGWEASFSVEEGVAKTVGSM